MDDRIRLAEAMGWNARLYKGERVWTKPGRTYGAEPLKNLPDPFNDANDDYAVLEWMRKNLTELAVQKYEATVWEMALSHIWESRSDSYCPYQIGDYARAALKVLERDDD